MGLEVRQAVHVGEVELAGGDVRGLAVHEAARILGAASPGEVLGSAVTRALAAGSGYTWVSARQPRAQGIPWSVRDLRGR